MTGGNGYGRRTRPRAAAAIAEEQEALYGTPPLRTGSKGTHGFKDIKGIKNSKDPKARERQDKATKKERAKQRKMDQQVKIGERLYRSSEKAQRNLEALVVGLSVLPRPTLRDDLIPRLEAAARAAVETSSSSGSTIIDTRCTQSFPNFVPVASGPAHDIGNAITALNLEDTSIATVAEIASRQPSYSEVAASASPVVLEGLRKRATELQQEMEGIWDGYEQHEDDACKLLWNIWLRSEILLADTREAAQTSVTDDSYVSLFIDIIEVVREGADMVHKLLTRANRPNTVEGIMPMHRWVVDSLEQLKRFVEYTILLVNELNDREVAVDGDPLEMEATELCKALYSLCLHVVAHIEGMANMNGLEANRDAIVLIECLAHKVICFVLDLVRSQSFDHWTYCWNLDDGELLYQIEEACSLALGVLGRGEELDAESMILSSVTSGISAFDASDREMSSSGSVSTGADLLRRSDSGSTAVSFQSLSNSGSMEEQAASLSDDSINGLDVLPNHVIVSMATAGSTDFVVESVGLLSTSRTGANGSPSRPGRASMDSPGWFFKRPLSRPGIQAGVGPSCNSNKLMPAMFHASMDLGVLAGLDNRDPFLATVTESAEILSPFDTSSGSFQSEAGPFASEAGPLEVQAGLVAEPLGVLEEEGSGAEQVSTSATPAAELESPFAASPFETAVAQTEMPFGAMESPFEAVAVEASPFEAMTGAQPRASEPEASSRMFQQRPSGSINEEAPKRMRKASSQKPPPLCPSSGRRDPSPSTSFTNDSGAIRTTSTSAMGRTLSADITNVATLSDADLEVKRMLGTGSFGLVFQMKPRNEVGFTAVKIIKDLKRGPTGKPEPEHMWQTFKSEWDASRRLRHRNIVRFERVFWFVPKEGSMALNPGEYHLCIEMEFCALGNLNKMLQVGRKLTSSPPTGRLNTTQKLSIKLTKGRDVRLSVARQIAGALDHMHGNGLCHRDLRPTNIVMDMGLVDTPDGSAMQGLIAKVCDFGACRGSKDVGRTAVDDVISPKYQAPEVLLSNQFGPKSDVFSFGVVLWELLTLRTAWEGENNLKVTRRVPEGSRLAWPSQRETRFHTHAALGRLIASCWMEDPDERPTMKGILCELSEISAEEVRCISAAREVRRSAGVDPRTPEREPEDPVAADELSAGASEASGSTAVDAMSMSRQHSKASGGSPRDGKRGRGCVIS